MSNFGEISNALIGTGKSMGDDIKLSDETKEEAIKRLDEVKALIEAEGLDGTQFILSHIGGERGLEKEECGHSAPGREQAKRSAILILKKKNGEME